MFNEKLVWIGIEGEDKETIIRKLAGQMVLAGKVKEPYIDSVLEREEQFPTGLPTLPVGVAIPHALVADNVLEPCVAAATLATPVAFRQPGTTDLVPVHVVFLLAIEDANQHLDLLRSLGKIFTNPAILSRLALSQTAADFISIAASATDETA